jgi:hypothetical protein
MSTRKCFRGVERGRRIRLTSPPPVSLLSRKYGIQDISQPYRPPQPVAGIALLLNRVILRSSLVSSDHSVFFILPFYAFVSEATV